MALVVACGPLSSQDQTELPQPAQAVPVDAPMHSRVITWQRTLADAETLAKATGRPLLLALNMDGESASDRIWHEQYRDPAFVALTQRCVCICASVFRHNANDYDEHGRRIPCPRLHGLTCGEHMALEPLLFQRYFLDGQRVAPRHALVMPDGQVAFDLSLCFDLKDIDRALAQATDSFAPLQLPPPSSWAEAAGRRDALGREALEDAMARCHDTREQHTALTAIAEHGDAGALPALRLVLAHAPEMPLAQLQQVGARIGLTSELRTIARLRAQRPGLAAFDLQPAADFDSLLAFAAQPDADLAIRGWLCGLAATAPPTDASWRAIANVWPTYRGTPLEMRAPISVASLLDVGARSVGEASHMPRPGGDRSQLATGEYLRQRLDELDQSLRTDPRDAETLAGIGIASLDLGRVELLSGGSMALLLFEDAANFLKRAVELAPDQYQWWIERARTAFYLQRFDQQRRFGLEALRLAGYAWPPAEWAQGTMLHNGRAIEAVSWIGDADARLFAASDFEDPLLAVDRARSALLALGLNAISPFAAGKTQVSFASFAASLGLLREETAILTAALQRMPASPEIRAALAGALWRSDQWRSLPAWTESVLHPTPSAEAYWWAGYARLQVAEELRRREQPHAAVHHYAEAQRWLSTAAEQNPDYRQSVDGHIASSWLGRGLAHAQGAGADRYRAADCLVQAVAVRSMLSELRDGLGYDALDLVDKILEWRAGGPGPVAPIALLERLRATAPGDAFWPMAVSDSALREALRADGRNADRVMADSVDAAGEPIRARIGLPTELGDRYLAAAITAGECAVECDNASDQDRRGLTQALTIKAERQLVREQTDGVQELLRRAAKLLDMKFAAADTMDLDALRTQAAPLRKHLGPARPRLRDGR